MGAEWHCLSSRRGLCPVGFGRLAVVVGLEGHFGGFGPVTAVALPLQIVGLCDVRHLGQQHKMGQLPPKKLSFKATCAFIPGKIIKMLRQLAQYIQGLPDQEMNAQGRMLFRATNPPSNWLSPTGKGFPAPYTVGRHEYRRRPRLQVRWARLPCGGEINKLIEL